MGIASPKPSGTAIRPLYSNRNSAGVKSKGKGQAILSRRLWLMDSWLLSGIHPRSSLSPLPTLEADQPLEAGRIVSGSKNGAESIDPDTSSASGPISGDGHASSSCSHSLGYDGRDLTQTPDI